MRIGPRLLAGPAALLAVIVLATLGASGTSTAGTASVGAASGRAFLSLVPACGCGRRTVLAAFSLQNGRRLRTITSVNTSVGRFLSLSGGRSGEVLATATSPAFCTSGVATCGPKPGTCRGVVSELVGNHFRPIFTADRSVEVLDAAASPGGREIAMATEPCVAGSGGIVVRDLASRTQWTVGKLPRCTGIGAPAWSSSGKQLAFPYAAVPNPRNLPPPGICPADRYAKLAITRGVHSQSVSAWRLVSADHGCSFEAATFDANGIAAVEGCRRAHVPESFVDPGFGQAVLVQLDQRDHVSRRFDLKPGWEQGVISTEPSGNVLVSQDQPANEPYLERDWVWEYDGHRLRLIKSYKALDAAEILAVPK